MKVREIDFAKLATQYEDWQVRVDVHYKETNSEYSTYSFDNAKGYLTDYALLDRECYVELSNPEDHRDEKFVRLYIGIELENYIDALTKEERKMRVKDIDFKRLQKEVEKYNCDLELTVEATDRVKTTHRLFDSATALNNYLTSRPRWLEYAESECMFRTNEAWDNTSKRIKKHAELIIRPCKKETPKVPYYQFCNGNVCNVNGTTYAPEIKDVIFNPPATIVKWADGTKSVVKADNSEAYDPEKGLAMAIARKMYGNKYDYYNVFKKWLKKFDGNAAKKALARVSKSVVNAWGTEPVSNGFRELEETDIKLKQLTGYDSKELLDLFAEGFTLVKECNLISEENKELVNCKDCAHFTSNPENDPWEDDGVCELDGKGTYTMNSCNKAEKKDE